MNLAPENTDNIIANLHDEVRRQGKVIASINLYNDKLQNSLRTALNLLSRGILAQGHTSRKDWDSFLDAWEIEARSLLSDEQNVGESK